MPTGLSKQGVIDGDFINSLMNGGYGLSAPLGMNTGGVVSLLVNGAVPITAPLTPQIFQINKAGVLADTLAAPIAVTDDGKMIQIISNTANAHTITATGLYQSGTAAINLATFGAGAGANMILMALNGKWVCITQQAVVFS
jgi:hypothetical protein